MAETHRAAVVYVCGVPFAVTSAKSVAALMRISVKAARLEVRPDGTLATMSREDTNKLCNQMVSRIDVTDIECTECEERSHEEGTTDHSPGASLGGLLAAALLAKASR